MGRSGTGVGMARVLETVVFIGILLAALLYLWRIGALDWSNIAKHTK